MKVEFEFDAEDFNVTAIEGVAALYCYDNNGEPVVLYGIYGDPSSLAAVGLYTVALRGAAQEFDEGKEYEP